MQHRSFVWAVAFILLVAISTSNAAEPLATVTKGTDAGILRATLPNGLRVVVVPNSLAPVVTTNLTYLAGSNDAPTGFPGTAHALEHMMFRGSDGLDKDQLAELGARLGGINNAHTSETITEYTFTVPAQDLGLVLKVEALRMRGALLQQGDWEQERGAINQEVSRAVSNPFYNYAAQVQSVLFAGTPYDHDALGTRESFDKTDVALLRSFHDRWYAPNNAVLVIAGDVDPPRALAQAQTAFEGIAAREVPAHDGFTLAPVAPLSLALATNYAIGLVTLAYRMPGLKSPDFAAADILIDVLNSQRGPLFALVPAGRALSAQFSYRSKPDIGYAIAIAGFPRGTDPAALLADLTQVIANAAEGWIQPDLVEAAKQQELAQLAFSRDSISGLADLWSSALTLSQVNSPDDLARAYAAVTVEDVARVAREFLSPDHATTAILTPRATAAPAAAAGFEGKEAFTRPPERQVTLPDWAVSALASFKAEEPMEPADVSVLPNGLRLIVHPVRGGGTVSVYGQVQMEAALQEPAGKEGVASLTDQLFAYGTELQDRLAFRKALDEVAAVERAGSRFSLKVLTPHFARGMQLLAEHQLRPAFHLEAFVIARNQLAQLVAGQVNTPDYLFAQALVRATVPQGDPTLRRPTPETVMALQLADLRAYQGANFRPDRTTIVVVGDVAPEEARRIMADTFGGWQAADRQPAPELPPIGPSTASQAHIANSDSRQERVTLLEAVTLPVTSPDRLALELGNAVLGSGFSSRLYRDLRINSGYVYSVSSGFNWQRTRARFLVSFAADRQNVDKARALILDDIRRLQTTPLSEMELSKARSLMLRRMLMRRASVGSIGGLYLLLSELNLPLDDQQTAARQYMQITAGEIQQAFATWLRTENLAQVVQGPL